MLMEDMRAVVRVGERILVSLVVWVLDESMEVYEELF